MNAEYILPIADLIAGILTTTTFMVTRLISFSLSTTELPGTPSLSYHADSLLDIGLAITMKLPTIPSTTNVATVIQKVHPVASREEHPSSTLSIFEEAIPSSAHVVRQFKGPRRPLRIASREEHPSSTLSIFEEAIPSSAHVIRQFKGPRRPLTVAVGA